MREKTRNIMTVLNQVNVHIFIIGSPNKKIVCFQVIIVQCFGLEPGCKSQTRMHVEVSNYVP